MKYIILITIVFLSTACFGDPFAMTQRQQIRANAAVAIAEAQRDAAIGAAQAEASKSQAWAMAAPLLAGIIVAGMVLGIIVYWQGRIYHTKATMQAKQILPGEPEFYPALRRVAHQHNAAIQVEGRHYYLVSGDQRHEVRALLPTK